MEKVNLWGSQKSNAEGRIRQDAANRHLRAPIYKESISPRPESQRKLNPQRNRELYDKRPRTRAGGFYEKYRSEIAENPINDIRGKQGSKKTNLNHLFNFTWTPSANRDVPIIRKGNYNRNKLPKYNKEHFLQANCQFVAKDDGDYSIHNKNPDILVEWSLIEEIHLPSYEVQLCPICLYPPIAAKITRCGHIYCFPCILHYLSLTDRAWQKCPICFDAVYKTELKSVSVKICKNYLVGDEITMCLMKKEKESLCPFPANHNLSLDSLCNVEAADTITCFQKLLLANTTQILEIINKERSELEAAYIREKESPEACFIESALNLLKERETALLNKDAQLQTPAEKTEVPLPPKKLSSIKDHNLSLSYIDSQENGLDLEHSSSAASLYGSENLHNTHLNEAKMSESDKQGTCYFYQTEDGQHIYMHNLNIRMLVKEFGSLEKAPLIIKAKIVEIERLSLTEIFRKRRYLRHLPLKCEIQLVELDFSSLISKETLANFEDEIIKRKHIRNRKARDERRREKYIQQEENKKLGKYPVASYNLNSRSQFPTYDLTNDFQSLPMVHDEKFSSISEITPQFSNANNGQRTEPDLASASFAQMLKDGSAKTFNQIIPQEKLLSSIISKESVMGQHSDNEDGIAPPEYRQSFSDAIQDAFDSFTIQEDGQAENQRSVKKKKGKKKLLFTTSMCRTK